MQTPKRFGQFLGESFTVATDLSTKELGRWLKTYFKFLLEL